MEGSSIGNERVVFVRRPGENNEPTIDCFGCEPCHEPTAADVHTGQTLVRTLYLSVDPAQRCRMNNTTGVDYLLPYELGELIDGLEGVGIIEFTGGDCSLSVGDIVVSCAHLWPWTKKFIADANDLVKVNLPAGFSPSVILSCVGMSGMTALLGIRKKAMIDRSRPQTIVISGAAGSCGTLAGQIARLEGCSTVIGICGSVEKCRILVSELGFDGAINYRAEAIGERLAALAPQGVDIYWDNVGGFVSDAVIQQGRGGTSLVASYRESANGGGRADVLHLNATINEGGRIVLCGQIAVYNTDMPYPPPIPLETQNIIEQRKILRERYLVLSYKEEMDTALAQLSQWLHEKKLKVKETVYEGLECAPRAFVDMMRGKNIGKMIVRVS